MRNSVAESKQNVKIMFSEYKREMRGLVVFLGIVIAVILVWFVAGGETVLAAEASEPFVFTKNVEVKELNFFLVVNNIDDYDACVAFQIPEESYQEWQEEIDEFYSDILIRGTANTMQSFRVNTGCQVIFYEMYHMTRYELEEFYGSIFKDSNVVTQCGEVPQCFNDDTEAEQWRDIIELKEFMYNGVSPRYSMFCKANIGKVYPVEEPYAENVTDQSELNSFSKSDIFRGFREVYSADQGMSSALFSWMVVVEPTDKARGESEPFGNAFTSLTYFDEDEMTEPTCEDTNSQGETNLSGETNLTGEANLPGKTESQEGLSAPEGSSVKSQGTPAYLYVIIIVLAVAVIGGIGWSLMKKKKKKVKMVVFCPSCGGLMKENEKVCKSCGHEVKEKSNELIDSYGGKK